MAARTRDLPEYERPRERLLARGPEALSDRELLAVILRHGTQAASSIELAASLLSEYGTLAALARARPEELSTNVGVGPAQASALVAAFQLGKRSTAQDTTKIIRTPTDAAMIARAELDGLRRERVLVLICDAAHRLRRIVIVSEGTIDNALVPIREILNAVLRHDGRAFAVAHNHPCGQLAASKADRLATTNLRRAASVVGLRFLTHIVISAGDWLAVPPLTTEDLINQ